MKSSHVRFDDSEYEWLQAVAKSQRRSVTTLISLLAVSQLEAQHAAHKPYAVPKHPTPITDDLFGDEPWPNESSDDSEQTNHEGA